MFKMGCHLSSSKGFLAMAETAEKIGANTFQFFTRNPRGGKAKALDEEDVGAFLRRAKELGIGPIVAHAPYTLNACGAEERVREFRELAPLLRQQLELYRKELPAYNAAAGTAFFSFFRFKPREQF